MGGRGAQQVGTLPCRVECDREPSDPDRRFTWEKQPGEATRAIRMYAARRRRHHRPSGQSAVPQAHGALVPSKPRKDRPFDTHLPWSTIHTAAIKMFDCRGVLGGTA
jgi:hypothetical protein